MKTLRASVRCAVVSVVAVAAGCSRASNPAPADPAPAASVSPPAGTLALGERVTAPLVALTDIVRDPARFKGQVLATSGKVTAVCQEMGCWMELQDASGRAHVRMHGHQFFVPKTSPGHLARVQATLVAPAGGADDCEEGKDGKAAKLELDATGVEID